jgi:hypothetical protein
MPLSFRPASMLLLAALLGAVGVAVAGPQQRREPQQQPEPEARMQPRRAPARPERRSEWTRPPPPRHNEDALSDSVRRVEQRTRGQVLSAERVPYDGRNLNRIKVVDEHGRVRVYMDDPQASQTQAPQPQASRQAQQDSGDADAPTRDNDD